jgi:hypothetical protein
MTFHPPFRAFSFPVLPFSSQLGPCVPTISYLFLNNDFKLKKWLILPGGPVMCRWLNHVDSMGI